MDGYLNSEYIEFDNDASASSFGWNFQANAGIFLFLYYIKEAESIKIESKLQDIEIRLQNNEVILSQAKSAHDYSACTSKKNKFKDAIVSLAKVEAKGDKLIYICNIPNTLESTDNAFNNKIVSYSECLSSIKSEIDAVFASTAKSINAEIEKLPPKESMSPKEAKRLSKLNATKHKVEHFDKSKLYISVIDPYWGNEVNRYQVIEDSILSFLCDTIAFDRRTARTICNNLLSHWQNKLNHNSTVKDKNELKTITKEDFLWPIIIFSSEVDLSDVESSLSFQADYSIQEAVKQIIAQPQAVYHERFQFTNKVLNEFKSFKASGNFASAKELHTSFLQNKYTLFMSEFDGLTADDEVKEYLTQYFMHKIVSNNRNINNIFASAGVRK